jgi:hypothetical protein
MGILDTERCGRCGVDPFAAGPAYTIWVWVRLDVGTEARPLHLCMPCSREFPSARERGEYLKLVAFG